MSKAKLSFRLPRKQIRKQPEFPVLLRQCVLQDQSIYSSFYRLADGYLLSYASVGDFHIDPIGKLLEKSSCPGVSQQDLELTYTEEVLPFQLSLQGKLVLHAAAVCTGKGAIAFLGAAGRGKSTLAASFASAGLQALTDDCLLLERVGNSFRARPSQPVIQIYPDTFRQLVQGDAAEIPPEKNLDKVAVFPGKGLVFYESPMEIRLLYFLGPGSVHEVVVEPMSLTEALSRMSERTFLLDPENVELRMNQLKQLSQFSQQVKCFVLDYPREYSRLSEVRETVLNHISTCV